MFLDYGIKGNFQVVFPKNLQDKLMPLICGRNMLDKDKPASMWVFQLTCWMVLEKG
jgi:hypothetical protein